MIEAILTDAVEAGAIRSWLVDHRLLAPRVYTVWLNDRSVERMSPDYAAEFCVGLAIGMGQIPDTTTNDRSYPCFPTS